MPSSKTQDQGEVFRAHFPALQKDPVYLDNAGGTQVLGTVIDSISTYLRSNNVQLGASYGISQESTARYAAAYEAGATYINAHVDEVVYGASTTQLLRNLSFALKFKPGDEIVISGIDHESNIDPWVDLAERQDLVIRWWKPQHGNDPKLLPEDLERLISSKTRLVACTHSSNVLGTINDVKAISKVAHSVGALICVDGVAYAPHRPIDVKDLDVDFYAFSWYKVYGPHIAMLYASWGAQSQVKSMGHFFNSHTTLENKLGLSAGAYELCQSVPRIVEYLGGMDPRSETTTWDLIIEQERRLQTMLLDYLNSRSDVTIYGTAKADSELRVPTVSFRIKGWDAQSVVEAVEAKSNHAIRWGSFYSARLIRENLSLDPTGVVRVSMVHYNTGKRPQQ